jgi:transcriptional regulator with XRE-family HTH domain
MLIESRLEAGFTQAEIAQLMFTSKSTVTRMESGRELPTLTTLEKWAEVTGKRLDVRFL